MQSTSECTYGTTGGKTSANCANLNWEQIPEDVIKPHTQTIDLSGNRFQDNLKTISGNLANLEKVTLSNCQIRRIYRTTFQLLWKLQTLDLRRNGLSTIEAGSFSNNTKLTIVDLSENHLETIEGVFNNNLPIVELRLNNNHIKFVGKDTFLLPKLDRLFLEYNDLTTIDLGTELTIRDQAIIYLNNNKWNCTCDLIPFRNFITSKLEASQKVIEKNMICATPDEFKGKTFWEVPTNMLKCLIEGGETTISIPEWRPNNGLNSDKAQMAGIPQNTLILIISLLSIIFILFLAFIIYICCRKGMCCWQKHEVIQPINHEDNALVPKPENNSPETDGMNGTIVGANQVAKPPRFLMSNGSEMSYNFSTLPSRGLMTMHQFGSVENMSPQDYAYRILNAPPSGRVSPASSLVSEPPYYGGMRRNVYNPSQYTTLPKNQPGDNLRLYNRRSIQMPFDKIQMLQNQILLQRRMRLNSGPGYLMANEDQRMPPSDNLGLRRDKFGGSQTSLNSGRYTPATPATPLTPGSIRQQWDPITEQDEHYY